MPESWLLEAATPLLKVVGWALNLQREKLKKNIWEILHRAAPQGLDTDGIQNEFNRTIVRDLPIDMLKPRWYWRWPGIVYYIRIAYMLIRQPTTSQIGTALYEMTKEGTAHHIGGRRYAA